MNDSAGRSPPAHHAWDALVGRRAGHDTTVTEHVCTSAPRHWLHGLGKRCSGAIGGVGDWGGRTGGAGKLIRATATDVTGRSGTSSTLD